MIPDLASHLDRAHYSHEHSFGMEAYRHVSGNTNLYISSIQTWSVDAGQKGTL